MFGTAASGSTWAKSRVHRDLKEIKVTKEIKENKAYKVLREIKE